MLALLFQLNLQASSGVTATGALATLGLSAPIGTAYVPINASATGALTGISLAASSASASGEVNALPVDGFNYAAAFVNAARIPYPDPAISRMALRTRKPRRW